MPIALSPSFQTTISLLAAAIVVGLFVKMCKPSESP